MLRVVLFALVAIAFARVKEMREPAPRDWSYFAHAKYGFNGTNWKPNPEHNVDVPLDGCCSWDGQNCGPTTDYCEQQQHCEQDCQGQWINGGGGGGGRAGTTRYWDCNQPFCEPGKIPYPHEYRMFRMSDGRIFGHAAASDVILQGRAACEKCYQLTYGSTIFVVKVDNWCPADSNPACKTPHFDLAVPGMDYAPSSASNVCNQVDSSINYPNGRQACSHWPWEDGNGCCFGVSSDDQLNQACNLFVSVGCDNCDVDYKETDCPY